MTRTGHARLERSRLLDIERMTMALAFLDGYQPAVCAVVLEATRQYPDGGAAITDGPEPYCTACGGPVGIFLGHGTDWRHFSGPGEAGGKTEVYEADHAPAVGWRVAAAGRFAAMPVSGLAGGLAGGTVP